MQRGHSIDGKRGQKAGEAIPAYLIFKFKFLFKDLGIDRATVVEIAVNPTGLKFCAVEINVKSVPEIESV